MRNSIIEDNNTTLYNFFCLENGEKLDDIKKSFYIASIEEDLTIYGILKKYISFASNGKSNEHTVFLDTKISDEDFKAINDTINEYRKMRENLSAPLLTDDEREYLKSVIKPFRENVLSIYISQHDIPDGEGLDGKAKYKSVSHGLKIAMKDSLETFFIPITKSGFQFANMGTENTYTLKELGL